MKPEPSLENSDDPFDVWMERQSVLEDPTHEDWVPEPLDPDDFHELLLAKAMTAQWTT